jgi:hypothetical protein
VKSVVYVKEAVKQVEDPLNWLRKAVERVMELAQAVEELES